MKKLVGVELGKMYGLGGVKIITALMALIIVYISVMGFSSLMGGSTGQLIGAIFGLAEIAFIIYFPTTIKYWYKISIFSKISMLVVIAVLGTLSFASTHSFITKSITGVTKEADQSEQDILLLRNRVSDNKIQINNIASEINTLISLKGDVEIILAKAIRDQEKKAKKLRQIIYNKGKLCRGDCADRKATADLVLNDASDLLLKTREEKAQILTQISSKNSLIDQLKESNVKLTQKVYTKQESSLEIINTAKKFAGYKIIGEKLAKQFNIDLDPIEVFTMMTAIILYSLYIILNIWLYGVIERKKKRSYSILWNLATKIAKREQQRENDAEIVILKKKLVRSEQYLQDLENLGRLVTVRDLLKAEKEVIEEEAAVATIERKEKFLTFIWATVKYTLSIVIVLLVSIAAFFAVSKVSDTFNLGEIEFNLNKDAGGVKNET